MDADGLAGGGLGAGVLAGGGVGAGVLAGEDAEEAEEDPSRSSKLLALIPAIHSVSRFLARLRTTFSFRDAFPKKKSIWRDIVPTSFYPLPPFKSRDKNRRDIFWDLDPPPPLKTREIC